MLFACFAVKPTFCEDNLWQNETEYLRSPSPVVRYVIKARKKYGHERLPPPQTLAKGGADLFQEYSAGLAQMLIDIVPYSTLPISATGLKDNLSKVPRNFTCFSLGPKLM